MVLFASVLIAGFITVLCVPSFQCLGLVFRWVWNLCLLYCLPIKSLDHCLNLPNPKSKHITLCILFYWSTFWFHTHGVKDFRYFVISITGTTKRVKLYLKLWLTNMKQRSNLLLESFVFSNQVQYITWEQGYRKDWNLTYWYK